LRAVTRKLLLFPLAVVLFLSACAPPGTPSLPIQANQQWFTSTVDAFLDAGLSANISLDQNGLPFLTYLSLNQKLPAGQVAPARSLTLPLIPAVMTASLSQDGIWNHGSVIATENQTKPLKLTTEDLVASTLDAKGNEDVAFTIQGELEYSSASAGGTFGSEPEKVTSVSNPLGLSIAATSDGTPYVAWLEGSQVMVATKSGKNWAVEKVATLAGSAKAPQRTALASDGDVVWLAYSDPSGQGPMIAEVTKGKAGPTANGQPIDAGAGGDGISLAAVKGTLYSSYYTNDAEVLVATSQGGSGWATRSVANTGSGPNVGWSASVAVTDKGTQYVSWYDAKQDDTHLASATSGSFKELDISGTHDGESPMTAVTSDGSEVFVAFYDKVNKDLVVGNYVVNGTPQFALAPVPSAGAPTSTPSAPSATCSPTGTAVSVVAPIGASGSGFEEKCYAAPAGQAFTIDFDNRDAGVPHNVEVFDTQGGSRLFGATSATDTITGVATTTYKVSPQKPGNYFFQCDIHPTTMFGTFVVK
jgi:plastocyanin